jgi:hypothetical protein
MTHRYRPTIYNAGINEEAHIGTSVVDRVIVFPRSGYINRLQATASAALLAEDLGADFLVCWEPQSVAASPADSVFSSSFCSTYVRSAQEVTTQFGIEFDSLQRYLTHDPDKPSIHLAGHDLGEQHFMEQLRNEVSKARAGTTLTITAGGNFFLPETGSPLDQQIRDFRIRRGDWYRALSLHPDIEVPARDVIDSHPAYLALHLRYTDRSLTAPTDRQIVKALELLSQSSKVSSLFVASDVSDRRDQWITQASTLGFSPWTIDHDPVERSDPRSSYPALIDWRVLGSAQAMVYFAQSSFAQEAAVAAGTHDTSIDLTASTSRVRLRGVREVISAAAAWPVRKLGSATKA